MPREAKVDATVQGAPYMLSVKPWPKIATGQPAAGLSPDGRKSWKISFSLPCSLGASVSVPTAGMYLSAFR